MAISVGANGIDWRSAVRQASDRVRAQVEGKVQAYASTLLTELELSTPIRTGQARASWLVALGQPSGAFYGPNGLTGDPGALAKGLPTRVDWSASQSLQLSIIRQWRPGYPLYIFNNLPYISKLNDGSSAQAPAGYVEAAVMRASAAIKG